MDKTNVSIITQTEEMERAQFHRTLKAIYMKLVLLWHDLNGNVLWSDV
jgi:hypothetical protein